MGWNRKERKGNKDLKKGGGGGKLGQGLGSLKRGKAGSTLRIFSVFKRASWFMSLWDNIFEFNEPSWSLNWEKRLNHDG